MRQNPSTTRHVIVHTNCVLPRLSDPVEQKGILMLCARVVVSFEACYAVGGELLATYMGDELVRRAEVNIHKERWACEKRAVDSGDCLGERGQLVLSQFDNAYRHAVYRRYSKETPQERCLRKREWRLPLYQFVRLVRAWKIIAGSGQVGDAIRFVQILNLFTEQLLQVRRSEAAERLARRIEYGEP